ncbi:DUF308 domain-containing protein [Nesterenkonia cremea]|uniref:DUF4352 domain-containing protein n=1 Tax=Nesterenkonia cremea TaxID=1882340 RepID=A0A917AKI7_9MICC|nr:DUF308 domain-containing protein [Nesterenkonia cremea]GGE59236.1 hypothetical protein GCM10011401_02460 [Nesterenkonia cremea]
MSAPAPEHLPETNGSGSQRPGRNVLGLIALITAILGAIFACVPGALILGWILLPIAFVLSLVSLFLQGKRRGAGIAGLIVSVVGTIIGVIVFFAVVTDAFDEAFTDETTASEPQEDEGAEETEDQNGAEEQPAAAEEDGEGAEASSDEDEDLGARSNPYTLGSELSSSDWTVTINSVDLDADAAIAEENPYNEAADEGHTYILVNVTATYTGEDPDGATPWVSVSYVSPEGNTFGTTDRAVVEPEGFDRMATLYEGASETGNFALHVPSEDIEDGVISVDPDMFADTVYVEVS